MAMWIVRDPEGNRVLKVEADSWDSGNLAAVFKKGADEVAIFFVVPGASIVKEENDKTLT